MNNIRVFKNPEFGEIRTVEVNNEPFFVGSDVARALGYSNTRDAISKHVDDEDKGMSQIATPSGAQQMTIISESGLYSLILSSKLEGAKKFKRWVTSEVLPSIRKSGGYMVAKEGESDDELMARALIVAQNAIKRKEERIKLLESEAQRRTEVIDAQNHLLEKANGRANALSDYVKEQNGVIQNQSENIRMLTSAVHSMEKKVSYVEQILSCKSTVKVKVIAQDYGMSAMAFNQLLHSMGIQYKEGESWFLYRRYISNGYVKDVPFEIEGRNGKRMKSNMQWTQKGRMFLYEFLKSNGILPKIEQ